MLYILPHVDSLTDTVELLCLLWSLLFVLLTHSWSLPAKVTVPGTSGLEMSSCAHTTTSKPKTQTFLAL
jgi:hypothetical protein